MPHLSIVRRLRSVAIWLPLASLVAVLSTAVLGSVPDRALERAILEQRERVAAAPTAEALSDLGNLLALSGRSAEARAAYEQALTLDPNLFQAHFNLGVLLLGEGSAREALSHLSQAVAARPESAWTQYHYGTALQLVGKRSEAIRAFARAFRLDPQLAFSDVNPGVIANPLLTEALLMAHDRPLGAQAAPRSYADPAGIVELLSPEVTAEPPLETPEDDLDQDDAGAAARPPEASEPPPVLDASSLEPVPEASTQPAPDAGGADVTRRTEIGSPPPAPRRRVVGPENNQGAASPTTVVAPASRGSDTDPRRSIGPEDLRSGGVLNQAQPGASPQRGRSRRPTTRFRPGRRSSAQLHLELNPRSTRASAPERAD